jgi:hypothetical protein
MDKSQGILTFTRDRVLYRQSQKSRFGLRNGEIEPSQDRAWKLEDIMAAAEGLNDVLVPKVRDPWNIFSTGLSKLRGRCGRRGLIVETKEKVNDKLVVLEISTSAGVVGTLKLSEAALDTLEWYPILEGTTMPEDITEFKLDYESRYGRVTVDEWTGKYRDLLLERWKAIPLHHGGRIYWVPPEEKALAELEQFSALAEKLQVFMVAQFPVSEEATGFIADAVDDLLIVEYRILLRDTIESYKATERISTYENDLKRLEAFRQKILSSFVDEQDMQGMLDDIANVMTKINETFLQPAKEKLAQEKAQRAKARAQQQQQEAAAAAVQPLVKAEAPVPPPPPPIPEPEAPAEPHLVINGVPFVHEARYDSGNLKCYVAENSVDIRVRLNKGMKREDMEVWRAAAPGHVFMTGQNGAPRIYVDVPELTPEFSAALALHKIEVKG